MDIDDIQAHGKEQEQVSKKRKCSLVVGVGAADIAKLKANGYYTVAVSEIHIAFDGF